MYVALGALIGAFVIKGGESAPDTAAVSKVKTQTNEETTLTAQTIPEYPALPYDPGVKLYPDVLTALCQKLIGRHTHIFGKDRASNAEEALGFWEKAKAKEVLLNRILTNETIFDARSSLAPDEKITEISDLYKDELEILGINISSKAKVQ